MESQGSSLSSRIVKNTRRISWVSSVSIYQMMRSLQVRWHSVDTTWLSLKLAKKNQIFSGLINLLTNNIGLLTVNLPLSAQHHWQTITNNWFLTTVCHWPWSQRNLSYLWSKLSWRITMLNADNQSHFGDVTLTQPHTPSFHPSSSICSLTRKVRPNNSKCHHTLT